MFWSLQEMKPSTIVDNDDIPSGDFFIEIISAPLHGTITEVQNGVFNYQADINYIGPDVITYNLCSESCECSSATITITIGEEAACIIPTIITPNNDGINDAFVIPCLADQFAFPNNDRCHFQPMG